MTSKRRNNGRSKMNRGKTRVVRCSNCGRCVPKDKAIKRFTVRNIVDVSSRNDIRENSFIEGYNIPKVYNKMIHCISCAVHSRIVRARERSARKIRRIVSQNSMFARKR